MRLNFLPYLQFVDNTQLNQGTLGDVISTDDIGSGVKVQRVKVQYGDDGFATDVSSTNPLPISGVIVGAVEIQNDLGNPIPVSATALPLPTGAALEAGNLATIAAKDFATQTTLALIKAKTDNLDTALSGIKTGTDKIPLSPATEGGNLATIAAKDFATQTTLALVKAKTDNLDLAVTALRDALIGVNSKTLSSLDTDLATLHTDLGLLLTVSDFDTKTGSLTETAPASDTASSGLNGRLQRIAQNITTLIAATLKTSVADGSNIVEGVLADAIVAAGASGSISAKLRRVTQGLEDLKTLIVLGAGTNVIGHVINDAGTALMGKVGIDQTTPGTTNAVAGLSSAANLTATTNATLLPVLPYAGWSITHLPTTATKATASKGAGGAGVRHVCTGFIASISTGATAQTPITVSIRDGASGAGTVLWSMTVAAPINGCFTITQSGLCLIGTAATAMTIEFSAAGVTASQETVSLQGFSTS